MIKQFSPSRWGLAAAFILALLACAVMPSRAAEVGTAWLEGNVVHVSTTNIKIKTKNKEESFLIVPHFDRVFSSDGKTTVQMAALKPGTLVKVYYDQKLLGARHADRIVILNRSDMTKGVQKG
jgi:hypothetical protein